MPLQRILRRLGMRNWPLTSRNGTQLGHKDYAILPSRGRARVCLPCVDQLKLGSPPPHVITWDLEIAIPVEEVPGGWEAVRRGAAGISCVCLFDTDTGRSHTYDSQGLVECMDHLNSADVLVGFNTIGFDTPVIESITGYTLMP